MEELFLYLKNLGYEPVYSRNKDIIFLTFNGYDLSLTSVWESHSSYGFVVGCDGDEPRRAGRTPASLVDALQRIFATPKEDLRIEGVCLEEVEAFLRRFETGTVRVWLADASCLRPGGEWTFKVDGHAILDVMGKAYRVEKAGTLLHYGHTLNLVTLDDWLPPQRVLVAFMTGTQGPWTWKRKLWRHRSSPVWASDALPGELVRVYRAGETVRPINTLQLSPEESIEDALAVLDAWTRWPQLVP